MGKLEAGPGSSQTVSMRGLVCSIKEIAKKDVLHCEADECVGEQSQSHPVCGRASQDQVGEPAVEWALLLCWKRLTTVRFTQPGNPVASSEITTKSICSPLGEGKLLSLPLWISAENESCRASLISFSNRVAARLLNTIIVPIILFTWPARQRWHLGGSWK